MELGWFLVGLIAVIVGAELLVRGAGLLAARLRVPPVIVGLTVVGYGTSTPELIVSLRAAIIDHQDIALGNVVGSNTFNILFILGLAAAVRPLTVAARLVRLDIPLLIGLSALVAVLALGGSVGVWEGVGLTAGLVAYTVLMARLAQREPGAAAMPISASQARIAAAFGQVIAGVTLLGVGAWLFVDGAAWLATWLGISQTVVALVIVAVGTSIPELATSVVATIHGNADLAVGNVVGSNLFNILGVLGIAAATGGGIQVAPTIMRFDLPIMVAVAAALLPVAFTGHRLDRWEGWVFLGAFAAYAAYLLLSAIYEPALAAYSVAMLGFVGPVVLLTLIVIALRELQARQRGPRQE